MSVIEANENRVKRLAIARMAVGLTGFLAPKTVGRIWIGPDAASSRIAMITRAFAIRDFALGLGAYLAVQNQAPVRGWIEAGLLSDLSDILSTLGGPVPALRKLALVGAATVAVAVGTGALQDLEGSAPPT
jgi:hypothetical protein